LGVGLERRPWHRGCSPTAPKSADSDVHLKFSLKPAIESSDAIASHQEDPMKFRPLHDRVVVRRIDAEAKTAGGIIVPDTAKEKPQEGEIIAAGPGRRDEAGKLIPIDVKPGDRVLFGKWSGTEVKIDGVEYLIMNESDIMGVLAEAVSSRKAA